MYARMLRIRHINPGTVTCYLLFEGSITLGFLVALAELADWWTVVALPATVALMVKVNDLALGGAAVATSTRAPTRGLTGQNRGRAAPSWRGSPVVGRARVAAARPVGRARVVPRPRVDPGTAFGRSVGRVAAGEGGPTWPAPYGAGRVPGGPGQAMGGGDAVPGGAGPAVGGADAMRRGSGPTIGGADGVPERAHPVPGGAGRHGAWSPDRSGWVRHRSAHQGGNRMTGADSPADRAARHSAAQRYR